MRAVVQLEECERELRSALTAASARVQTTETQEAQAMGLWDIITRQFIGVIEWMSDENNVMVKRFDREENVIKYGVMLTHLSRIKALKTTSRTSVLQYKDTLKTIPRIAAELGVINILEGSIQRSGDRVRINMQLIDARTDEHLWADIYDRYLRKRNNQGCRGWNL